MTALLPPHPRRIFQNIRYGSHFLAAAPFQQLVSLPENKALPGGRVPEHRGEGTAPEARMSRGGRLHTKPHPQPLPTLRPPAATPEPKGPPTKVGHSAQAHGEPPPSKHSDTTTSLTPSRSLGDSCHLERASRQGLLLWPLEGGTPPSPPELLKFTR